ncbi:MAG: type VI secretion system ImpA family N-terminal domain-containing protein [Pseudomonadota bacterium]
MLGQAEPDFPEDAPSGEDLRHHPGFMALVQATEPSFEGTGSQAREVPVRWDQVLTEAEGLMAVGRDLRLLVIVVRGLIHTEGMRGFTTGLSLITDSLDAHWETIHPGLRAGGAPQEQALRRLNALRDLESDRSVFGDLTGRVYFQLRGLGPLTGTEIAQAAMSVHEVTTERASGLSEADKAKIAGEHGTLIDRVRAGLAASRDQEPGALEDLVAATGEARAALARQHKVLAERLEGASAPLPRLDRFLERFEAALAGVAGPATEGAGEEADGTAVPGGAVATGAPAPAAGGVPGRVNSREDAMAAIDRIIEFFERTEPSSPIPHVARRLRRMIPMTFLELMEEVAPSGVKEFRSLAGLKPEPTTARKEKEK